jgi:hypothetical protein
LARGLRKMGNVKKKMETKKTAIAEAATTAHPS